MCEKNKRCTHRCTTLFCQSCFKTPCPGSSGKSVFLSVIFEPRPKHPVLLVVELATASIERRCEAWRVDRDRVPCSSALGAGDGGGCDGHNRVGVRSERHVGRRLK